MFMEVCFPRQYTRVQYIASLICIPWNIYTINSFNLLGHISHGAAENFQCECLYIRTWLVELYHPELYAKTLFKPKAYLLTKVYHTNSCNRTLFEKVIVLKMIYKFVTFRENWRFITALTSVHNMTVFHQIYAVHVPKPCIVKNIFNIILTSMPRSHTGLESWSDFLITWNSKRQ
jgi:hypothetical protein